MPRRQKMQPPNSYPSISTSSQLLHHLHGRRPRAATKSKRQPPRRRRGRRRRLLLPCNRNTPPIHHGTHLPRRPHLLLPLLLSASTPQRHEGSKGKKIAFFFFYHRVVLVRAPLLLSPPLRLGNPLEHTKNTTKKNREIQAKPISSSQSTSIQVCIFRAPIASAAPPPSARWGEEGERRIPQFPRARRARRR